MINLSTLTIVEARRALDAKEYSAEALAESYLAAISEKNAELNIYLEVFSDVLDQARVADVMLKSGTSHPLTGIPLAIKDNILIEGKHASSGSKILENYIAPYSATVIEKLRAEGAVLLGRTNMDEFALGSSTENSAYGPTKNPIDPARVSGGTSGGSVAAVASGLALGALGSDTGGSIRQPASFCGVVGLKPTYGAVSRFGLMAAASSLDQIGPIARNVEDAQILFDAIRGADANDGTSLPESAYDGKKRSAKVVGVPRAFLTAGMDADVKEAFDASLVLLQGKGYTIKDIELPTFSVALAAYYIINSAEVSTNLARFDGIRYGLSSAADSIKEVYEKTRATGFGREVQRRILTGAFVLSSGYVDAYYRRARAIRASLRSDLTRAFESVDVIALPTSPTPAFLMGEKSDPLAMYAADIFTVPMNLAGVPAISVPQGTVIRNGKALPVGFQLIAPHQGEEMLFAVGKDIEKA